MVNLSIPRFYPRPKKPRQLPSGAVVMHFERRFGVLTDCDWADSFDRVIQKLDFSSYPCAACQALAQAVNRPFAASWYVEWNTVANPEMRPELLALLDVKPRVVSRTALGASRRLVN
jgi:ribosomal protein L34E